MHIAGKKGEEKLLKYGECRRRLVRQPDSGLHVLPHDCDFVLSVSLMYEQNLF